MLRLSSRCALFYGLADTGRYVHSRIGAAGNHVWHCLTVELRLTIGNQKWTR
jgi:hypothetical protein